MPATQPKPEFQALCHEHHVKMKFSESSWEGGREGIQTTAYACTMRGCHVHFSTSRGYFLSQQNEAARDLDSMLLPRVRCSRDGTPMYLAEIGGTKKAFRLWVCPQCDSRRTNADDLVQAAS